MSFMTFLIAMRVGSINSTLKNFVLNSSKDLKSKMTKKLVFFSLFSSPEQSQNGIYVMLKQKSK